MIFPLGFQLNDNFRNLISIDGQEAVGMLKGFSLCSKKILYINYYPNQMATLQKVLSSIPYTQFLKREKYPITYQIFQRTLIGKS